LQDNNESLENDGEQKMQEIGIDMEVQTDQDGLFDDVMTAFQRKLRLKIAISCQMKKVIQIGGLSSRAPIQ
jgi:hypothetical protein